MSAQAKDVRVVTRIHPTWLLQGGPVKVNVEPLRVCMKCKRLLDGTSNRPVGEPVPAGPNQSHGICVECVRAWAEEMGLSAADVDQLEATAKQAA